MRRSLPVATAAGTALVLSALITFSPAAPAVAHSPAAGAHPSTLPLSGNGTHEIPATAPAPPQPPGPLPSIDELEAQMLSMVNAERAAVGAGAVQQVAWAQSVARQHSQEMAAAADIWHNIAGFINRGHGALGATYLGENVAMDSTLAADDALLYSDIPHRRVTLDSRFNFVGIGIALDSRNWVYVTEDFAQIPGGAPRKAPAVAPHTGPVAAAAVSHAPAAPPAPIAHVAKAPAAVAPAAARPEAVAAAPAPPAVAVPTAAPAPAPALATPIIEPAQTIVTRPVSRSSANRSPRSGSHLAGLWILLGLVGVLAAGFGGRRLRPLLGHAPTPSPADNAGRSDGSSSSQPPWRQAA